MHAFPQLVPSRVRSLLERVERLVWWDARPVEIFRGPVTPAFVPWSRARRARMVRCRLPLHWGRLWDHTWFRVRMDRDVKGARWLRWRDQAEATLYVDGEPWQGLDVAHGVAPLPPGCRDVWVHSVCCQSAIWHPAATGLDERGSLLRGAETVRRDDAAWAAYHDLLVLQELMAEEMRAKSGLLPDPARPGLAPDLTEATPRLRVLLAGLDRAADAFDRSGLAALRGTLAEVRRGLRADRDAPAAVLTGHAHIDLVWLWPEAVGEAKAVHTFATVDRLLAEYPEMRFAYSQPASYEAVGRLAPGLLRRVRARMKTGQWEANGAMYVESDTLLAAGEPLLRSFQYGQEWFREMTGGVARTLWLPDVFGYAGCVPQLARLCGVDSFFTNKLTWSRVSAFPHSSFVWRGSDGSELVAHVSHEARQFYNGTATVRELRDAACAHRQVALHPEFLVPTGYGDGGGGPTAEMAERARRMADLAGVPRARWGRVDRFFRRLARVRRELPVWTGEIYLEYHRGVFTTHCRLKSVFRAAERALQAEEAASCLSGQRGEADQRWRRLVFAQFHDAVTGSSVHEVYAAMQPELASLSRAAAVAAARALRQSAGGTTAWFNPLPLPRTVVVPRGGGSVAVTLPPLSCVPRTAAGSRVGPVRIHGLGLENGRVSARFNRAGAMVKLTVDGRSIAWSGPGAQLVVGPDHPHAFDAWEIDQAAVRLGEPWSPASRHETRGDNSGEAVLSFFSRRGSSRIATHYRLEAGASVLGIEYEIDWQDPQALLRCRFPTAYQGQQARFGMPFGSVRREQWQGRAAAEAQWTVPGNRWAMVTDDSENEGLMLMTEDRYGFGCRAGVLEVNLLRSALVTGEAGKAMKAVPHALRRARARPRWSDLGRHRIRLAVGRWRSDAPREEMPAALAESLFSPAILCRGPARDAGLLGLIGGESLVPAWAKPLDASRWLLRLHETLGRAGEVRVQLAAGWRLRRAGVLDRPGAIVPSVVPFRAYEVIGLVFERR